MFAAQSVLLPLSIYLSLYPPRRISDWRVKRPVKCIRLVGTISIENTLKELAKI